MAETQTTKNIKELKEELDKITGFIGEYGIAQERDTDYTYACNISDGLSWVLGEISTKRFRSDAYLDLAKLKRMVTEIEQRTRKIFEPLV